MKPLKQALLFDFKVNKEDKTIVEKREFDANIELVWKAWTTPALLEQWRAPKPHSAETKTMDFREGGYWHYAIVSPQGAKHWSRHDYQKIEPLKSITEWRAFSDENGMVDPNFPRTHCTYIFSETNGKTLVTVTAQIGSSEIFKKMATESHKKGLASTYKNLDKVLETLKQ